MQRKSLSIKIKKKKLLFSYLKCNSATLIANIYQDFIIFIEKQK